MYNVSSLHISINEIKNKHSMYLCVYTHLWFVKFTKYTYHWLHLIKFMLFLLFFSMVLFQWFKYVKNLEYASLAWKPHTACSINKLESVQRRAARFVLNDYNYGPDSTLSNSIVTKLKWLPLQHRRSLYDLAMFFKIKNNLVNISFPSTVQLSYRSDVRYNRVKILHSDAYKYSFFVVPFAYGIYFP